MMQQSKHSLGPSSWNGALHALRLCLSCCYVIPRSAPFAQTHPFRVTVDYQKQGRKVVGLKFKIRRVRQLPTAGSNQPDLFPDLQDLPVVVKILKEAGIAVNEAWEIWQQGFDCVERGRRPADTVANGDESFLHYVREKIHLLHQRQKSGKLASPSGFLLTALNKNYAN